MNKGAQRQPYVSANENCKLAVGTLALPTYAR